MNEKSFVMDNRPERFFETAEEAWMWFCYCESTPKAKKDTCPNWTYPCEPVDIAIIVKRLAAEKKLSQTHLKILSQFGLKQLPPHEKSGDSKIVCSLWKQALLRIFEPLRLKGIVSFAGRAFLF